MTTTDRPSTTTTEYRPLFGDSPVDWRPADGRMLGIVHVTVEQWECSRPRLGLDRLERLTGAREGVLIVALEVDTFQERGSLRFHAVPELPGAPWLGLHDTMDEAIAEIERRRREWHRAIDDSERGEFEG